MNGTGQYYDFNCHSLLTYKEAEAHRQAGCDVDTKSQRAYEEEAALDQAPAYLQKENQLTKHFQMGGKP